jgi:hypothetical protein
LALEDPTGIPDQHRIQLFIVDAGGAKGRKDVMVDVQIVA